MQVIYITDTGDASFNPNNITLDESNNIFVVNIKDNKLSDIKIEFNKMDKPEVKVDIPEPQNENL